MLESTKSLGSLLQQFFQYRLTTQQNVSVNTLLSYRDAWKLYTKFLLMDKKRPESLCMEDVSAENILRFLDYLENDRGNSIRTRNQRLAAFTSFAQYVLFHDPSRLGQMQRILHIPKKRYERTVVGYLTKSETNALLSSPNRDTNTGKMHYAILYFMYNTGARVSEVTKVTISDLTCRKGYSQVLIHGKCNKDRVTPIWDETAQMLIGLQDTTGEEKHLFRNREGAAITRSGIAYIVSTAAEKAGLDRLNVTPHVIRHTTAMRLLQSGVDINLIRMWLGHVKLDTTHQYVEADLEMKRKALEKGGIVRPQKASKWTPSDELLAFLDDLGKR